MRFGDMAGTSRFDAGFAMGAYGICGIPLWNGYVSKTLLHESIVEYIEVLGARGADALPFQVLEWAFLLAGGLTVAYMAKLFAAIFLERPQWAGRGMTGKSGTPARLPALPWAALLVSSLLWGWPPTGLWTLWQISAVRF